MPKFADTIQKASNPDDLYIINSKQGQNEINNEKPTNIDR